MAHEVEMMAYAGEVPWHGLGVRVEDDLTPEEMMERAGVNWTVSEVPTFYRWGPTGKHMPTGQKALVRDTDGKILTQVGPSWKPVQNHEAFEFFKEFTDAGNMKMHTAGSLKGGCIVWALAKVNEGFELFGGDQIESYLLFSNPHLYGKSIDIRFTPIRVVCNNTLTMSLTAETVNGVRLNHRTEFDPEEVKATMGLAHDRMERYKETAEFLGSRRYTNETLKEFYREIFGSNAKDKERLNRPGEKAMAIVEKQPGHDFAPGSWWQAYNAVTYLADHELGRRPDSRLESAWFGLNQRKKLVALDKAVEYAKAA